MLKTNGEILSYDHIGGLKNQKSPKILKLKLAPGWPGITLLEAKELALRVISFKQLGVSPDSGMMWLRFGIRKLIFHQYLRKTKNLTFCIYMWKIGGKTFSL